MKKFIIKSIPAVVFTMILLSCNRTDGPEVRFGDLNADFRYSPEWWQASICLPDDPYKTIVSQEGELLYDYNGKYFRHRTLGFKTAIGVVATEKASWVEQGIDNAETAIVKTIQKAPEIDIKQEAFALTFPEARTVPGKEIGLLRFDKGSYKQDWMNTAGTGLPDWCRTAAVNDDHAIHYQFPIEFKKYQPVIMALAFCENEKPGTKGRELVVKLEGTGDKLINPYRDHGPGKPGIYILEAWDHNRDGRIDLRVSPAEGAASKQVFLNAFWCFPEFTVITGRDILRNELPEDIVIFDDCSSLPETTSLIRDDVILVTLTNNSNERKELEPEIILKSIRDVEPDIPSGEISIGQNIVTSTLEMKGSRQIIPDKWLIQLEPVTVEPRQEAYFAVIYHGGSEISARDYTVEEILEERGNAEQYWINESGVPFDKISVPDENIQALVQSSIRNIWQAREIRRGLPVFQVGPTEYRNLWIVDGAFLLETATMLGAIEEARNGVKYVLGKQNENGSFEVLTPTYYKENGIVIWTTIRHALLTQDMEWLEENWESIEGAFNYILKLREIASRDPDVPWYGINPPGEIDGGLSAYRTGWQYGEYSNAYWNLMGMKAAIQAAHWLDKEQQAEAWQAEYDAFYARVRETMKRDMRQDEGGNYYLPIFMENATNAAPQKGQWCFCQAVYPGQLFEKDDTLVTGNLAMLKRTEQEGMIVGTAWLDRGIWTYFASFYGHAWLWQGNGRKAAECLYAFANHASPTLVWVEEQNTLDNAFNYDGDMPHNWASAEFVRLTVHMLALDRGNELHLLAGLPGEWAKPGMETRLNGVATPFGLLYLDFKVDASGKRANLKVRELEGRNLERIVVHQSTWSPNAEEIVIEGGGPVDIEIPL